MSPRLPRMACLRDGCRRRPVRWWVTNAIPHLLGYCLAHEPDVGDAASWRLEGPYNVRELQVRRVLSS